MRLNRIALNTLSAMLLLTACGGHSDDNAHRRSKNHSFEVFLPNVETGNQTLDIAYRMAAGDLFTNIHQYKIEMTGENVPVILAGIDYNSPWIRDASINSWNAGSFIVPEIAQNTLLSVLNEDEKGNLRPEGQYWDAVIWSAAAWNHYLIIGDDRFLRIAYQVTINMLDHYERTEFNAAYNLFRGLGWSDGVAAYPEKYANTNLQSGAFLWPQYNKNKASTTGFGIPMMATSTNCLYYYAYRVAEKMSAELGEKETDHWGEKSEDLKAAINRHLWNERTGVYSFYIDEDGVCELQEALGSAYAIMFGIADESQTESIFRNQHVSNAGVT